MLTSAGIALIASCLVVVWLLPATQTRAATGDDVAPATGADSQHAISAPGATNFGTAVPSDRFVQSFQQQVSQQLQAALAQSNQLQESRMRQVQQEQKDLSSQLQALQQSISNGGTIPGAHPGFGRPATGPDPSVEAPQVNVRKPAALDPSAAAADAGVGSGGAPLGGLLSGLRGAPPGAAGASSAGAPADASAPALARVPGAALRLGRAGDPNVAPNGFIEGMLLNGVVSIVGGPERESIVALTGSYQSANGFVDDLDGCFALVQGRPEVAAGRIDFKLSRLTCNFPDGASRTWDTAGWLVDADGIRGVRASIVENASRKALVAAAGGALGGIGQRLSQEQYQVNSVSGYSAGGLPGAVGTSSTFIGSPTADALGGAAAGAAGAVSQSISDYYNLYAPSLQVGGGTPVTVVLANDLRLPPSGRELSETHTAVP